MTQTQNTIEKRGLFAWLMQRVSGVFLAYALVIHLWTVNVVNQGELNWQTISSRLQEGNFWFIYYMLFIPAVIYHAFNGLWSIVLDYNPSPAKQRLLGISNVCFYPKKVWVMFHGFYIDCRGLPWQSTLCHTFFPFTVHSRERNCLIRK